MAATSFALKPQMQLPFDLTRRPRRDRAAFYNTTGLTGDGLAQATTNARKQDVLVLTIFRGARGALTPSEVWRQGAENGSDWLLTSVRRSMNTLTREGLLEKCETLRDGPFGRGEHTWRLVEACRG